MVTNINDEKTPKRTSKTHYLIIGLIFLGAITLRFGLSLLNRQANDPHMPVIRYIIRNDQLPEMADCWGCFQPKLFHYTIAKILVYLDLGEGIEGDLQKMASQMINALAGIVTLVIAWIFIIVAYPAMDSRIRVLAFALVAFNPQLIGINSQVTNDTFLIMFCVLAVFCSFLLLKQQSVWIFLALIVFSSWAVATKTNGWVTVIAICITLFIMAWMQKNGRAKILTYAILYLLAIPLLAVLNPLTQYRINYQRYGSPVVIPLEKKPAPLLFEKTFIPYAGILSIQDGFLTFKFFDLIKNPITDLREQINEPTHRTSLWTLLYGSAHSVHFENFPRTWRASSQEVLTISRLIFILALIPTVLMLVGTVSETYLTLKGIFTQNLSIMQDVSFGLIALVFIGHMLFIALYAFEYRAYIFMKAIFILPGLLSFPALFVRGLKATSFSPKMEPWFNIGLAISVVALVVLYIWDVTILIFQLLPNWSETIIPLERLVE